MFNFKTLIDLKLIFLENYYNDKSIYNNAPYLLKKLKLHQFLSQSFSISNYIQFLQCIVFSDFKFENLAIISYAQLFSLLSILAIKKVIVNLEKNETKVSIVDDMYQIQVTVFVFINLTTFILMFIHVYFWIDDRIVTLLMLICIVFNEFLVANQVQLFSLSLMLLSMIVQTIKSLTVEVDSIVIVQAVFLNFQILTYLLSTLIQILVLGEGNLLRNERVKLSFETMHDLRNYIYSQIELMNPQNKFNSNVDETCDDDNNPSAVFRRADSDEMESLEKSLDFENKEAEYHQKFILFKVCFLYHTELIFENMYNLKPKVVNVKELLLKTCYTLKILFMNKNNSIKVNLNSGVQNVIIDQNNFEYVILEMTRILHNMNQDSIEIDLNFCVIDNGIHLYLKFKTDKFNYDLFNEVRNNNVIKKLVKCFNQGVIHSVSYVEDENELNFQIDINNYINDVRFRKQRAKEIKAITDKSKQKLQKRTSCDLTNGSKPNKNLHKGSTSINRNSPKNHSPVHINNTKNTTIGNLNKKLYNHQRKEKNERRTSIDFVKKDNDQTSAQNNVSNEAFSNAVGISTNENEENKKETNLVYECSWTIKKKDMLSATASKANSIKLGENQMQQREEKLSKFSTKLEISNSQLQHSSSKISRSDSSLNPVVQSILDRIQRARSIKRRLKFCDFDEISTLAQSQTPVDQKQTSDGLIYINVDDEENILRMNARICRKESVELNCVKSGILFANLLMQIQADYQNKSNRPSIVAIMDHMLDREQGQQAVEKGTDIAAILNLPINFVLLSSTEDKETLHQQTSRGVEQTISKPMNKSKFVEVNTKLREKFNFVEMEEIPNFDMSTPKRGSNNDLNVK